MFRRAAFVRSCDHHVGVRVVFGTALACDMNPLMLGNARKPQHSVLIG